MQKSDVSQEGFRIRELQEEDLENMVSSFTPPWSTLEGTKKAWELHFREQKEGIRISFLIEKETQFVGYGSLLRKPEYPYFMENEIPEISWVWVDAAYRRQGLGKQLICHLEQQASLEGHQTIGIGVGLYKDYGSAQRLYIKLGYLPDGNGITYRFAQVTPGEKYPVDDDLIMWLTKSLTG